MIITNTFSNLNLLITDLPVSRSVNNIFPHSNIILPLNDMKMSEKGGTECGMIENHSTLLSVIEWVSNVRLWLKRGQDDEEKNLGHLP